MGQHTCKMQDEPNDHRVKVILIIIHTEPHVSSRLRTTSIIHFQALVFTVLKEIYRLQRNVIYSVFYELKFSSDITSGATFNTMTSSNPNKNIQQSEYI